MKKRMAIVALISLASAFMFAYMFDEPIIRLISTIFLTLYVMLSIIIIIYDICQ